MVFVLPNIRSDNNLTDSLAVEDWYLLKKFPDNLKMDMVNSFAPRITMMHHSNIYFDKLISAPVILSCDFTILKPSQYIHEHWIYRKWSEILLSIDNNKKEVYGMNILKRLEVFYWERIYLSNIFYRFGSTKFFLSKAEWSVEEKIDSNVPNLILGNECNINLDDKKLRNFLGKLSLFNFENFDTQFNRFFSWLERKRSDLLNASLDFIILIESLLVEWNSEVSYQFSLHSSLFFERKSSERIELMSFFKLIYNLRSRLVHWNKLSDVKKAIEKLYLYDPMWFKRLLEYSQSILLHIISHDVKDKNELLRKMREKIKL
jgi:Apea-like HEPN